MDATSPTPNVDRNCAPPHGPTPIMRTIVAHSDHVDVADAIREVLTEAEQQLAGDRPLGGLLYATTEYDHDALLAAITARWPGLPLIGASTAGEVSSKRGYCADSVCLTLFAGQGFEVVTGQGLAPSQDVATAVQQVLAPLGQRKPALAILHCPGTVGNPSEVLRVLHQQLGARACPIVGGLAGDHELTRNTRQFFGRSVTYDSLAVMFLCGDVRVSWGVASGWFPIGGRHRVTRSLGNKVFAIEGKPAVDIYQSFWGDKVSASMGEFPLAVFTGDGPEDFMLRAAMSIDEAEGSVTFAGDVPEGSIVSLTEVVPEGLLSGTETSVRRATTGFAGGQPAIALLFSCAARKWVLGSRAEGEIERLTASLSALGLPGVDFSGFYAFGEICPLAPDGPPLLHNETCVTVLVG